MSIAQCSRIGVRPEPSIAGLSSLSNGELSHAEVAASTVMKIGGASRWNFNAGVKAITVATIVENNKSEPAEPPHSPIARRGADRPGRL